jgi:hypothetical protein
MEAIDKDADVKPSNGVGYTFIPSEELVC